MIAESLRWAGTWLGIVLLLSFVAFPLAHRLLPGLPSRGVALCPPLGVLLVSYLAWLAASLHLAPFGRASLVGGAAVVAALSALSEVQTRGAAVRWLRRNGRVALWFVLILVAAFAVFAWVRGYRPEVRSTEKPMEIGFLESTLRTRWMPPADPWFAGGHINYYYFGFVEAAALSHLAGVTADTGFNLTNVTLFAFAVTGGCGLAYDLLARNGRERGARGRVRPLLTALVGGLLLVVAGNAYAAVAFLRDPVVTLNEFFYDGVGWKSTRVIVDVLGPKNDFPQITEFPAFSFLLGDNHPHVLALPLVLLALGVALSWWGRPLGGWRESVPRLALTALALGVLYPTNAWDVPTYGLVIAGALLLRRPARWRRSLGALAGVVVAAYALFLPFHRGYVSPLGGNYGGEPAAIARFVGTPVIGSIIKLIGLVVWPHTSLGQFLYVFGLPYLAVACLVGRGVWGRTVLLGPVARQRLMIGGIVVVLVALLTKTPMLIPTGALFFAGIVALLRPLARPAAGRLPQTVWTGTDRAATAVALLGLLLPTFCEFVYLRDAFDNRLNTMFKLDFQAWTLLMVAGAYGVVTLLALLHERSRRWLPEVRLMRGAVVGAATLAFALFAVAYPLVTTYARTGHLGRTGEFGGPPVGWQGLSGFAYAKTTDPNEYAAVQWLSAHAADGDHLVEAAGNSYGETGNWFDNRFSAASGVPTVLGWFYHEVQWRGGDDTTRVVVLPERSADVKRLYETTNLTEARAVLVKYGVDWVVVGNAERVMYGSCGTVGQCDAQPPAPGLAKFGDMLDLAYQSGNVAIYHVPPGGK